jgi:hypothetical protein
MTQEQDHATQLAISAHQTKREREELEVLRVVQARVRAWAFESMPNTLNYVRPPHEQNLCNELDRVEQKYGVKAIRANGDKSW